MINLMKNWFSRYNLSYPRSIIYMLQASEYNIRDYLLWYRETDDFSGIEKRKRFTGTLKGRLMLLIAWLIVFSLATIILFFLLTPGPFRYFLPFLALILMPHLVAYGIIIPLILIEFLIQRPIEYFAGEKTRKKLKNHQAIKIGIAGSFGKTTMREILKTILSEGMKVAAPTHNYNTPMGINRFVKTLKGDEKVLIFEMGEYCPGDIRKLCRLVNPDIGVITGVNEAHLKRSKSLERTVGMIFEIADYLGDKPLYVNGESDLAKRNARPQDIIYSRDGIGEWKAYQSFTDLSGTSFVMEREEKGGEGEKGRREMKIKIKTKLLGLHQIGPITTAVDIALKLGLSPEKIERGVEKTEPFDHRLKPKLDLSGIVVVDDSYNGNPDGVAAAIDFLSSLTGHRRFYLTPGLVEMGHQTEKVHREIGRKLAKSGIEKVVLIRNSVTSFIEKGLKDGDYKGEIIWFSDSLSALSAIPLLTVKGDVVLLQNDWPDQYK